MQLVALLMLTAILLPVISVTDDLQACQNPAEVERYLRKGEIHFSLDQSQDRLPVALAVLISCLRPQHMRVVARVVADEPHPPAISRHLQTLWTRPPPAA